MSHELLKTDCNSHYVYIQNVKPSVDGGQYPVKRRQGDTIEVKLIAIDEKSGKLKLSRKVLLPKPQKENN